MHHSQQCHWLENQLLFYFDWNRYRNAAPLDKRFLWLTERSWRHGYSLFFVCLWMFGAIILYTLCTTLILMSFPFWLIKQPIVLNKYINDERMCRMRTDSPTMYNWIWINKQLSLLLCVCLFIPLLQFYMWYIIIIII